MPDFQFSLMRKSGKYENIGCAIVDITVTVVASVTLAHHAPIIQLIVGIYPREKRW